MKPFIKRYKFILLAFLILVPIIVFAANGLSGWSYRLAGNGAINIPFYAISITRDTPLDSRYNAEGVCFTNPTANDYFIPNRTQGEWVPAYNATMSGGSLYAAGVRQQTTCCEDGLCKIGVESCSCPDCNNCSGGETCPANVVITNPATGSADYYPVTTIVNRCWMAKDLNIGYFISSPYYQINNSLVEKSCPNSYKPYCASYGALYNQNEAMNYSSAEKAQGICPASWHIPSSGEFVELQNLAGAVL